MENGTYITIKKFNVYFGKCGPCPVFASYTPAFALQLRKKHAKTSVRLAACTLKADTVQYKNNEQYNTQKKTVTQSSTLSQNNKKHRIHYREHSPYQVSK
jgi:predicted metal-binding protein